MSESRVENLDKLMEFSLESKYQLSGDFFVFKTVKMANWIMH